MDLLSEYLTEVEDTRATRLGLRLTRMNLLDTRAEASGDEARKNILSLERRRRQMEYDLLCLKSQERQAAGDEPREMPLAEEEVAEA